MQEATGLSAYTIRKYARDNKLPAMRRGIGKRSEWLFHPDRVMRVYSLLAGNKQVRDEVSQELAGKN